jgi:hypothetical protein
MDSFGRLLLRFLLVPLGYLVAVMAGTLVILIGSWRIGLTDVHGGVVFGFVFAAPVLLVVLLSVMWLPCAIGILASELFAIRSWIFHAGNGALAAWIGWSLFGYLDDTRVPLNEPLAVIAAGLLGGLVYWAIAGWSAGFWRPVFRNRQAVPPAPHAPARSTQVARNIEEW